MVGGREVLRTVRALSVPAHCAAPGGIEGATLGRTGVGRKGGGEDSGVAAKRITMCIIAE